MPVRYLKIALVFFIGFMALIYALQNLVNIGAAHAVVGAVLGMENHEYYASSLGPPITSPALVWLALATIILAEIAAGILALFGSWQLWRARKATGADFNAAKSPALLGCGIGVIVWFGFFGSVGSAWFQMWQTELGAMSLGGAFQYAVYCALVLIFVNMKDE